jgi:Tfp pilus assembly protein PilP
VVPVEAPTVQIPLGTPVGLTPSGYDDGARRDPFISLVVSRRQTAANPAGTGLRPGAGLNAVAVADVKVVGIVRDTQKKLAALLEGPNRMSFTARPDDNLLDGVVKSVDTEGVVFVEQISDAAGTVRSHEVRKTLRVAEVIR